MQKTLGKQKLNFSCCALFHVKITVSLKIFCELLIGQKFPNSCFIYLFIFWKLHLSTKPCSYSCFNVLTAQMSTFILFVSACVLFEVVFSQWVPEDLRISSISYDLRTYSLNARRIVLENGQIVHIWIKAWNLAGS